MNRIAAPVTPDSQAAAIINLHAAPKFLLERQAILRNVEHTRQQIAAALALYADAVMLFLGECC